MIKSVIVCLVYYILLYYVVCMHVFRCARTLLQCLEPLQKFLTLNFMNRHTDRYTGRARGSQYCRACLMCVIRMTEYTHDVTFFGHACFGRPNVIQKTIDRNNILPGQTCQNVSLLEILCPTKCGVIKIK